MKNNLPEKFRRRASFFDDYSLLQRASYKEIVKDLEISPEEFVCIYCHLDQKPRVIFCSSFLIDLTKSPFEIIDFDHIESFRPAASMPSENSDLKMIADSILFKMDSGLVHSVCFPGTEGVSRDAFEVVNLIHILQRRRLKNDS
jgi:hypothetical protein